MSKVFMTKASSNVKWGFDLNKVNLSQANDESTNTILCVKSISEQSPAYGKLSVGDQIIEIAGNTTNNLTEQQGYDIIQKCGNALFLTISPFEKLKEVDLSNEKVHEINVEAKIDDSISVPSITQPPALDSQAIRSPASWFSTANEKVSASFDNEQPTDSALIPEAPVLSNEAIKKNKQHVKRQKQYFTLTDSELPQKTDESSFGEFQQRIPEKLLSTMNKPGMKPFTYTPRGVDLDEIMEKARKRQINRQLKMMNEQMMPESYQQTRDITTLNAPRTRTVQEMSSAFTGNRYTAPAQQSRSFNKLTGWVNENASKDHNIDSQNIAQNNSPVAMAIKGDTTSTYIPQKDIPSNVFKNLQRSCGSSFSNISPMAAQRVTSDPNTHNISFVDMHKRVPASHREHEPEAQKYQGSDIPSKSFRLLQEFTETPNTKVSDSSQYIKPNIHRSAYEHRGFADTVPSRSFKFLQQISGSSLSDESPFSRQNTPRGSISKVSTNATLYSTEF